MDEGVRVTLIGSPTGVTSAVVDHVHMSAPIYVWYSRHEREVFHHTGHVAGSNIPVFEFKGIDERKAPLYFSEWPGQVTETE